MTFLMTLVGNWRISVWKQILNFQFENSFQKSSKVIWWMTLPAKNFETNCFFLFQSLIYEFVYSTRSFSKYSICYLKNKIISKKVRFNQFWYWRNGKIYGCKESDNSIQQNIPLNFHISGIEAIWVTNLFLLEIINLNILQ